MNFALNTEHAITLPLPDAKLNGLVYIPTDALGLVLFVHGSGSSRLSVRNQHVAHALNKAKLATLLFDLFTPEEDQIDSQTAELRFNIDFLATRLINTTQWCLKEITPSLPIGYFGASTGGGAALVAAAQLENIIKAVVSRGGRPDLAQASLPLVKAPTLLIVGGNDSPVIEMNQSAQSQMQCTTELKIIPGATHLFEEPGALDEVARLAKTWFLRYLKNF